MLLNLSAAVFSAFHLQGLLAIDRLLFDFFNATSNSPFWLVPFARFSSNVLPAITVMTVLALLAHPVRAIRFGAFRIVLTMAIAWCVARAIQAAIPLPRPFMLNVGVAWMDHTPSASFPSTHATVAFAFGMGVFMAFGNRHVQGVAIVAAGLIAWSRICLGLHFPSDVIAGAAVAAMATLSVQRFTYTKKFWTRPTSALKLHDLPLRAPNVRQ